VDFFTREAIEEDCPELRKLLLMGALYRNPPYLSIIEARGLTAGFGNSVRCGVSMFRARN
jgi:hypothetical protein